MNLTLGELVLSGKFGNCHCYAKNPAEWYLAASGGSDRQGDQPRSGGGCGCFVAGILPELPRRIQRSAIDALSTLRLPR